MRATKEIERISFLTNKTFTATFKSEPKDFLVTEVPKFLPLGDGEHLWLYLEKNNANTDWVADELARITKISRRNISYAGRKDRFAITQQWFSIYDPKRISDDTAINITGVTVLNKIRHQQKLRTGQLQGNEFTVTLRNLLVSQTDKVEIDKGLSVIKNSGFPNYFGSQRFGRQGNNLLAAREWMLKGGKRIKRNQQSLYFSTLRSYLFNAVLAKRVQEKNWNQVLLGELALLSGSRSTFIVENVAAEQPRCTAFDIHPTGPLVGKTGRVALNYAAEMEAAVINQMPEVKQFLIANTKGERRCLRVLPETLSWQWFAENESTNLQLQFKLPAGAYATVLLEQLFELI